MKQSIFEITENREIARNTLRLGLRGDTSAVTAPGQFVNIRLEGLFLRRPISVCDAQGDLLTLIYKPAGEGTRRMAKMQPGERLDLLTGLGNGFDPSDAGRRPLLVGGGAGAAPMLMLARVLAGEGASVTAVLGFGTAEEIYLQEELKALGIRTVIATADGSAGVRGFVTDAMKALADGSLPEEPASFRSAGAELRPDRAPAFTGLYCCGPEPMLRAVYQTSGIMGLGGQFSFERRMGCGFGACMGCSCRTITGYKRICREGPVLRREEILWED